MDKDIYKAIDWMRDCINDLQHDVEKLDSNQGIQLGNSSFDYMNEAVNKLEEKIKKEGHSHA